MFRPLEHRPAPGPRLPDLANAVELVWRAVAELVVPRRALRLRWWPRADRRNVPRWLGDELGNELEDGPR